MNQEEKQKEAIENTIILLSILFTLNTLIIYLLTFTNIQSIKSDNDLINLLLAVMIFIIYKPIFQATVNISIKATRLISKHFSDYREGKSNETK